MLTLDRKWSPSQLTQLACGYLLNTEHLLNYTLKISFCPRNCFGQQRFFPCAYYKNYATRPKRLFCCSLTNPKVKTLAAVSFFQKLSDSTFVQRVPIVLYYALHKQEASLINKVLIYSNLPNKTLLRMLML